MVAWKFWNGPELGDIEVFLDRKFQLDPGLEMWTEIWPAIFSLIPDGVSGLTFACRLWKDILLGSSYGDLVSKWIG